LQKRPLKLLLEEMEDEEETEVDAAYLEKLKTVPNWVFMVSCSKETEAEAVSYEENWKTRYREPEVVVKRAKKNLNIPDSVITGGVMERKRSLERKKKRKKKILMKRHKKQPQHSMVYSNYNVFLLLASCAHESLNTVPYQLFS